MTEVVEEEERARGAVSLKTYCNYAKAGRGSIYLPLYLLVTVTAQVTKVL